MLMLKKRKILVHCILLLNKVIPMEKSNIVSKFDILFSVFVWFTQTTSKLLKLWFEPEQISIWKMSTDLHHFIPLLNSVILNANDMTFKFGSIDRIFISSDFRKRECCRISYTKWHRCHRHTKRWTDSASYGCKEWLVNITTNFYW